MMIHTLRIKEYTIYIKLTNKLLYDKIKYRCVNLNKRKGNYYGKS